VSYVIRSAKPSDLQSIYEMAKLTGGGFTNLPPDRKALRAKLDRAEASFASDREYPSDELYLMMLEDTDTGEVRGTCQIFGQVGQRWPFYSYRIGTDSKHSEQLGRTFHAQVLMLSNDLNGSSEVGSCWRPMMMLVSASAGAAPSSAPMARDAATRAAERDRYDMSGMLLGSCDIFRASRRKETPRAKHARAVPSRSMPSEAS
jgi:hypothetical protein